MITLYFSRNYNPRLAVATARYLQAPLRYEFAAPVDPAHSDRFRKLNPNLRLPILVEEHITGAAASRGGRKAHCCQATGCDRPRPSRWFRRNCASAKRDVSHGRVRVRSYVMEEPVNEQVNLREERVVLERRPVDRELGSTEAAFEDRTIEAEERAEEAVVDKQAKVVEEVALRKEADERTETISDTVRHTEVEVEDERANQITPDRTKRGL